MELKEVTLGLTETEIGIIHDALIVSLKKEAGEAFYKNFDDFKEYNKEELELTQDITTNFGYSITIYPEKTNNLKKFKDFDSIEEMMKVYIKAKKE